MIFFSFLSVARTSHNLSSSRQRMINDRFCSKTRHLLYIK